MWIPVKPDASILWLQEVLRGEDRDLLCLAGLLHGDAVLRGADGRHLLHLRSAQLRRQRVQVSYSCS